MSSTLTNNNKIILNNLASIIESNKYLPSLKYRYPFLSRFEEQPQAFRGQFFSHHH